MLPGFPYPARIAAARLTRFSLAALALAGAALALYAAGLRYPSVFDDDYILAYLNPLVPDAVPPRAEWLRSLATHSFVWVHAAFGRDIVWQRLANVLAHAATGIVLCGFLARLFETVLGDARARWLAFFGALWFVVHPVAVYGTAYLTQRSIVLATLFSLVALWCVLEGLQRRRAGLWYAAAALAYVLALLCKEHAVMLPAVAVALVVLVRGVSLATLRAGAPWLALAAGVTAVIVAAVLATRSTMLGAAYEPYADLIISQLGIDPALVYPLSVENQALLFCRYFTTWLMPWPGWLAIDLRTPFPRELLAWPYSASFALWLAYAALGA